MTHNNKILYYTASSSSSSLSLFLSFCARTRASVCAALQRAGSAFSAMATRGALLLCALFFLSSTLHPACSCPEIFQDSCTGYGADPNWQSCGSHRFRCKVDGMEIKFGGREPPFKVLGPGPMDGLNLEVEDPTLSPIFAGTSDCDFLYTFLEPGPPFDPPPTTLPYSPHHLQSYCKVNNYTGLFSDLIKVYQHGPCTTYDVYCQSKGLENSEDPALLNRCPPPGPADPRELIWRLSLDNQPNSTLGFKIVSVGFSSRHRLDQECFNCNMTGVRCDSASAGYYACGKKHLRRRAQTLIIGGGAGGDGLPPSA